MASLISQSWRSSGVESRQDGEATLKDTETLFPLRLRSSRCPFFWQRLVDCALPGAMPLCLCIEKDKIVTEALYNANGDRIGGVYYLNIGPSDVRAIGPPFDRVIAVV
jgi:hypothetical protein